MLGTVRPDNTFEFTNDTYGLGDRIMLSNHSNGYFNVNSRLGGLVYTQGHALMPIYKGMRVDCNIMKPTEDFSVFVKNVDRSKSKNLLKNYENSSRYLRRCSKLLTTRPLKRQLEKSLQTLMITSLAGVGVVS
jgi:hypothetical protein